MWAASRDLPFCDASQLCTMGLRKKKKINTMYSESVSGGACLNVQGTRPLRKRESMPEYATPPHRPREVLNEGRRLRTSFRSFHIHDERRAAS